MSNSFLGYNKIFSLFKQGTIARSFVASAGNKKPANKRVKGELIPGLNISTLLAKPARPLSAYNLFVREKFDLVKNNDPSRPAGQILSSLAAEWKTLDSNEKAKFLTEAKNQRTTTGPAYKEYRNILSQKVKISTVVKSIQEAGIVKRPKRTSGFNLYVKENFESLSGPLPSRMQTLSNRWKQLPESQKQQFNQRASELPAK